MMRSSSHYSTDDKEIRIRLKSSLSQKIQTEKHVLLVEELGLHHGDVRIDLAIINGSIHGFEIKSDQDTLSRLPEQMRIYNSIFDRVTLVTGKKHAFKSLSIIPEWWGVVMAIPKSESGIEFINVRDGEQNSNLDRLAIAKLLWRNEALSILEEIGEDDGIKNKPRLAIYERLAESLNTNDLANEVRQTLIRRKNWRCRESFSRHDDLYQPVST